MEINSLMPSEKGHYILRLMILITLANLFLCALLSFASSIKLASMAMSKNNNYTALGNLETYQVNPTTAGENLNCNTNPISGSIKIDTCQSEDSNKTITLMSESYE